jgi:hypothetical protein
MLSATLPNVTRQTLPNRPSNMAGPAGLLSAIIHQALLDYHHGDITAAEYFDSSIYKQHLDLLGLPSGWLPETVKT